MRGYEYTILRLATVYGPGAKTDGLFDSLFKLTSKGSILGRLNWPGRTSIVHVEDVAAIMYTFTLNLVQSFTSGGQAKTNTVSSTVQVHYNDSFAELASLGFDFLVNKFGNFNVSPQDCVSNFSNSCRGKADELSDITNNRKFFHILSATFSVASIDFNADKTFANVNGPCVFEDIDQSTGVRERVTGNCLLTGVYENFKWLLCDSHFESTAPTVPFEKLRYRAPGVR